MTISKNRAEFDKILAALHERELTDWERELLWNILDQRPEWEEEFLQHCQLPAALAGVSGIERPLQNIVAMPGVRTEERKLGRSVFLWGSAAAVFVAIGVFVVARSSSEVSPSKEVNVVESAPIDPSVEEESAMPRRVNLSDDDPIDEAVALSGPAALANSRSPRGGEASGIHVSVPTEISFNHHVRPILSENCTYCHGTDEKKRKADLRLDTFEGATRDLGGYAAVVPGDLEGSELWHRITSEDSDDLMPPADSHRTLSGADKEILRRWIEDGAEYEVHWAFQRIERPEVPAGEGNPIDRFVEERLEEEGVSALPRADARTLYRRLSVDLTGLPPSVEALRRFEGEYTADAEGAVSAAIDDLLASPHFGERMALPWLDAARYADSNGFQQDGNRHQWPWRDWVVKAFNDNMPFDQFTVEQLAGDLLDDPSQDQLIATAFNRNHMLNGEGGAIREEQRVNYVVDRVDTTATTWLGLTMACAQCHSHKYDPITHRDYFQFFAFFNQVPETGGVDIRSGNGCAAGSKSTVQYARPTLKLETQEHRDAIAEVENRLNHERGVLNKYRDGRAQIEREWLDKKGVALRWVTAVPVEAAAEHQALEIQSESIVFASGENPKNDTYTVTYQLPKDVPEVHQLRLEALQEASHTNNGKGLARSDSGNFVLTELEVRVGDQQLEIASGQAPYEQHGFPIENTFDGKPNTGWAVHRGKMVDKPELAYFRFKDGSKVAGGEKITLTFRHDGKHPHHNLGRFRVSVGGAAELPARDSLEYQFLLPIAYREKEAAAKVEEELRIDDPEYKKQREKIEAVSKELAAVRSSIPEIMIMEDKPGVRKTHILDRGNYLSPTDEVTADTPSFLPAMSDGLAKDRLGLARWIVSRENPLTARVIANRFWQQLMGVGLVKTSEDFGVQGELPSHPALLDWLAMEFMESGWDVKGLVRLIVSSAAYRRSSEITPELLAADPENRLYARSLRYRLPSSLLRDQALAAGSLLRFDVGGHPVYPHQPEGLWLEFSFDKISYPHMEEPEQLYRRSLYTFWRRTTAPPNMFDSASRQVCTVKSAITNTPLQALTLMNDITYVEAARGLGGRMAEAGSDVEECLSYGFEIATGRVPLPSERAILKRGFEKSLGEFEEDLTAAQSYAETDDPRRAAFTRMAQVMLNLDETLNRN